MAVHVSMNAFIYVIWIFLGALTVPILGVCLWRAWWDLPDKQPRWRLIKASSSALGLVGFFLLVFNFEQVMRSIFVADTEQYVFRDFLTAKFLVEEQLSIVCARDRESARSEGCHDLQSMNDSLDFDVLDYSLKHGTDVELLKNWNNNPALKRVVQSANSYIGLGNSANSGFFEKPMLSNDDRITLTIFSMMLVMLSVVGALGESIYQYRQTVRQAGSVSKSESHDTDNSRAFSALVLSLWTAAVLLWAVREWRRSRVT